MRDPLERAPSATHHLVVRREAAQAVIDAYKGKPLEWGLCDCGRLMGAALRGLGHSPRLSRLKAYRNEAGARAALKAIGAGSPQGFMDQLGFPRIPPAAALPGDIVALPGDPDDPDGWASLTVAVGNGRVLGFHAGAGACVVMQPLAFVCAWRVDPKSSKARAQVAGAGRPR